MPPQFLTSSIDFLFGRRTLLELRREANQKALDQLLHSYGENRPQFFVGSFREARQEAQTTGKMLLAYIHCAEHQDSDRFCGAVLFNNDLIREYIDEHFVLWLGDVGTPEGAKLAQDLGVTTYPHFSVLHANGTIIEQLLGYRTDLELIQELTNLEQFFTAANEHLNEPQIDREQIEIDRILRGEQEEAYQASLAADRQREMQQRALQEAEQQREQEEQRRQVEKTRRESELKNQMERRKQALPLEPTSGPVLSLAFRLPNGKRVKRKFAPDNSVQVLYDYVDTHPENTNGAGAAYTLESNYPKNSYPPSTQSLAAAGVPNNTVLEMIYL